MFIPPPKKSDAFNLSDSSWRLLTLRKQLEQRYKFKISVRKIVISFDLRKDTTSTVSDNDMI